MVARLDTHPMVLMARDATDLMTPELVALRPTHTLRQAASLLLAQDAPGALVIGGDGGPVGAVTTREVLRCQREQIDGTTPVESVMLPRVVAVPANLPAAGVIEILLALDLPCVFVADLHGELRGIVGMADILRRLSP